MRPDWLDDGGGKLTVIDQNTLLPKECLPTFNNCAVELLLDRIPGLADRFIYMNDDMFFLTPCEETDFFRNGKPCDTIAFSAIQGGLYAGWSECLRDCGPEYDDCRETFL